MAKFSKELDATLGFTGKLDRAKVAKDAFYSALKWLVISIIAAAIFVGINQITWLVFRPARPSAKDRIAELNNIRTSLEDLQRYVEEQQHALATNAEAIQKLDAEIKEKQAVLTVTREQAIALLSVSGLKQTHWYEKAGGWIVSFVIGVLSSLTATRWIEWRRVKHAVVHVTPPPPAVGQIGPSTPK
jgi:hypothetical protein